MAKITKNSFVRAVLGTVFFFLTLVMLLFLTLQVPYVQTKLIKSISQVITQKTGFRTTLDYFSIRWFDVAEIEGIKVYDTDDNLMLDLPSVTIDFKISSLIDKEDKRLDLIELWKAKVFLTKTALNDSTKTLNLDLFLKQVKKAFIKKAKKGGSLFSVSEINVIGCQVKYLDTYGKPLRGTGFNYKDFNIKDINGEVSEMSIIADTVAMDIRYLEAMDSATSLQVHQLQTFFRVSQSAMEFYGMNASIGQSTLSDTLRLSYESIRDLSSFNDKVDIHAHLNGTELHTDDIALFAPSLLRYDDLFKVSGVFNGKVNSFTMKDFGLNFGKSTQIKGKMSMFGLPVFDETFIDLNMVNSTINILDLKKYITPKTYNALLKLEEFGFNGQFTGYKNDFVAKGDFITKYGRAISDINLKIAENINDSRYSGRLNTTNFNLGGYFGREEILQYVTVNGKIEGSGLTFENADFKLEGNIKKIGFRGYEYQNIHTDARFAKELFEGKLSIDDPNLQLSGEGSIDLRDGHNAYSITAQLDTIQLKALKLSDREITIGADLDIDARGLQLDSIIGTADIKNLHLAYEGRLFEIDSLQIVSSKEGNQRNLGLKSNIATVDIEGGFLLSSTFRDFKELLNEYRLNVINDRKSLNAYYKEKASRQQETYRLNYRITLLEINELLNLFLKDTYISPKTEIIGNFSGGYTTIFSLNTLVDSIHFRGTSLHHTEMDISSSKIADSTNVLAIGYLLSESQNISKAFSTKDMILEAIWNNDHIDFKFDVAQEGWENYVKLGGMLDFLNDRTRLKLLPSNLRVLEKDWQFSSNNQIEIMGYEVSIDSLTLSNSDQQLSLNGALSQDIAKSARLLIDNFKLENLNPIIDKTLDGVINGELTLHDYYGQFRLENEFRVDTFKINDFLVGDISGMSHWDNEHKNFHANFYVDRKGSRIVDIEGTYNPKAEQDPLNLKAKLNGTQLGFVEPFLKGYFSNLSGLAYGDFRVSGTLEAPKINGKGSLKEGRLKVDYLNTDYQLDGEFSFAEDLIKLDHIDIRDEFNQEARLRGHFSHHGFRDFEAALYGKMSNFQVLNTTIGDNNLFYGSGYATGSISFIGPIRNMSITADAKSEKGTKIFIPIGGSETVAQKDYIHFVSLSDTVHIEEEKAEEYATDVSGLNLNLNLDITEDTYCEIIFDIKAGDIIRGRGTGQLKLEIDTKGDFNMFGDYIISSGGYNFTLYNIINKEFDILPGSRISWYGDPYGGILDINAIYKQLASLSPIVKDEEVQKLPEILRKYPTEVHLALEGPLLSPSIDFDITMENYPKVVTLPNGGGSYNLDVEVNSFKTQLTSNEQEMNRQVFSLIVLRKLSPPEFFDTGGFIGSSVSEFISNQLSYWVSQVDENLEIDVDLGTMDPEAVNTFQLRLSYTFLDGRLRVTRDGGFRNQYNETDITSIAGDWTVEYLLTPDGKFRAKMYNRSNFSNLNSSLGTQTTTTTGFSLLHTQTFNEVKELFKKAEQRKKEKEKERKSSNLQNKNAVLRQDDE